MMMPGTHITKVTSTADIRQVVKLAREIWNQHFVPIIGQGQVDYMLEMFQSTEAITQQIAENYEYYLVREHTRAMGYFCLVLADNSAQLSKLYLLAEKRGQGLGRDMLNFCEQRCREAGIYRLWLTVNRQNAASIRFYEKTGFINAGTLLADIGNGYVMDDYKMEKYCKGPRCG